MNIKLFSKYKKNIILINFFLSILSISAIAVIIFSVSIYYLLMDKALIDINKANSLALSKIDTIMSNYFDSAKRISMELYQSPEIKTLILEDGELWNDNLQKSISRINSTMSVNNEITSIVVVSKSQILLKHTNKIIPEKYENTFMEMIKNNRTSQPLPWVLEMSSGTKTNIVSIFFKDGTYNENYFNGAVMINMDMDILYKKIFENLYNNQQQIYIVDKSGRVLLHNDMEQFANDISSEAYFKEVINRNNEYGSFDLEIDGKNYSLIYMTSSKKEYYTIALIEYELSTSELASTRNAIIIICLAILFCILILSFVISKRIYRPIKNIFSNIKNVFSSTMPVQRGMNEIQLVSQTITGIVETMNDYEKEKVKNIIKKFFRQTRNANKEEMEGYLKILNLTDQADYCYFVVIFRVSNYKTFVKKNTSKAADFQMNSMGNIVSDILNRSLNCCYFDVIDDHVFFVLREFENQANIDLRKLMEDTQAAVQQIFGLEVALGVSEKCGNPAVIKEKYKEAFELTNYRLLYGKLCIIDSSMIREESEEISGVHIKAIHEAVMKNSKYDFIAALDKLICECRRLKLKYCVITETFYKVAFSMLKIPEEIGTHKSDENLNTHDIIVRIEGMEDYEELKTWLVEIYDKTIQTISKINNIGINDIFEKALEYIEDNFNNPDVTANYIAEKLSISPSYFSRIFKTYSGVSFPEYITNLRLEKAKEILIQDDMSYEIKEICYKVGYSNTSYFTAAFKKKFGTTPSKYRRYSKLPGDS